LIAGIIGLEPLPVIPLAYAPPDAARRYDVALPVCEALRLAICATAFAVLFVTVESVLATGPLICFVGALMIAMGAYRRDWARSGLGAGHVGISVLFVALVNFLSWSPGDAELPFKWMGGCYVAVTVGASICLWFRERQKRNTPSSAALA
jgi:hypothetical protein